MQSQINGWDWCWHHPINDGFCMLLIIDSAITAVKFTCKHSRNLLYLPYKFKCADTWGPPICCTHHTRPSLTLIIVTLLAESDLGIIAISHCQSYITAYLSYKFLMKWWFILGMFIPLQHLPSRLIGFGNTLLAFILVSCLDNIPVCTLGRLGSWYLYIPALSIQCYQVMILWHPLRLYRDAV